MHGENNVSCLAVKIGGKPAWIRLEQKGDKLAACELRTKGEEVDPTTPLLKQATKQLGQYFSGNGLDFDLPIEPDGTSFQKDVWKVACSIPAGEVRTYGWIAEQLGKPGASRAVGSALGANPLLLLVPCHRVLRTGGGLGGFACGLEWKQLLLDHERAHNNKR